MDGSATETILVVDDERLIRVLAQAGLERYGYHVLTADSGQMGCELFAQHRHEIALVLADVLMPDMTGPEMATLMLRKKPGVKIVFFTATIDAVDEPVRHTFPVLL